MKKGSKIAFLVKSKRDHIKDLLKLTLKILIVQVEGLWLKAQTSASSVEPNTRINT